MSSICHPVLSAWNVTSSVKTSSTFPGRFCHFLFCVPVANCNNLLLQASVIFACCIIQDLGQPQIAESPNNHGLNRIEMYLSPPTKIQACEGSSTVFLNPGYSSFLFSHPQGVSLMLLVQDGGLNFGHYITFNAAGWRWYEWRGDGKECCSRLRKITGKCHMTLLLQLRWPEFHHMTIPTCKEFWEMQSLFQMAIGPTENFNSDGRKGWILGLVINPEYSLPTSLPPYSGYRIQVSVGSQPSPSTISPVRLP